MADYTPRPELRRRLHKDGRIHYLRETDDGWHLTMCKLVCTGGEVSAVGTVNCGKCRTAFDNLIRLRQAPAEAKPYKRRWPRAALKHHIPRQES